MHCFSSACNILAKDVSVCVVGGVGVILLILCISGTWGELAEEASLLIVLLCSLIHRYSIRTVYVHCFQLLSPHWSVFALVFVFLGPLTSSYQNNLCEVLTRRMGTKVI